jgi:hypothetical protein
MGTSSTYTALGRGGMGRLDLGGGRTSAQAALPGDQCCPVDSECANFRREERRRGPGAQAGDAADSLGGGRVTSVI